MTPELRRALDAAYDVFARDDSPNCCGFIVNLPVGDLTLNGWRQLSEEHDMGVLLCSDDGEMLRCFLPRWLDWLSDEASDIRGCDLDMWWLGLRLTRAKWRDWATDEVTVLRDVFRIWTREEIAEFGGAPPDICSRTPRDLGEDGEQLGLTDFSASPDLLEFLAEIGEAPLYMELWLDVNLPQLARWLWTEDLNRYKTAREWIVSSRLEDELEAAFFADSDGPDAPLFSRSIELVRSLRAL